MPEWAWVMTERAAKTPDEFLQRVKLVWDNPQSSVIDFVTNVTKIPLKMFRYGPVACHECEEDAYMIDPKSRRLLFPAPYTVKYKLNGKKYGVKNFKDYCSIYFLKTRKRGLKKPKKSRQSICIDPDLVKNYLGAPSKISAERNLNFSYEKYIYTNNNKNLIIEFPYRGEKLTSDYPVEDRKNMCAKRIKFAVNHKLLTEK